jgi:ribonucleoside-diphosphate reductase alpha chain
MNSINFLEEMGNFTFAAKYAKYDEKRGRREVWEETVNRLEKMHLKKFSHLPDADKLEIKWAFDLVRNKRVAPSMRSLQFGGKAIEAHNARMFNCSVMHIESLRSFAEAFYMLLCGCGVGFGLSKKFLGHLPDLVSSKDKTGCILTYTVQDDIEGWADSVEALLMSYFRNTPFTGRKIVFDYSRIRTEGTPLKTGGGKAPGYKGLKAAHIKIKDILDYIIEENKQPRLKTIDAYDILMHCADAVLSGGIRRSACAVIFDINDVDMLNAKTFFDVQKTKRFVKDDDTGMYHGKVVVNNKTYDVEVFENDYTQIVTSKKISWYYIAPQRARSNNSTILFRDKVSLEQFENIVNLTQQFGEPGFVFADSSTPDILFNPCFEVAFEPITDDGRLGVQVCNLTTTNGAKIKTEADMMDAVKAAALIGTLQATYTNFPYLSLASKELTEREALLGVSITGIMENPDILLNPEIQTKAAILVKDTNAIWANKLGINKAARTTLVKPEGTASIVLGTSSGIHAHHARKYIRRIQCNKIDPVYKFFKKNNPHACEQSVWSATKSDDVVSFPIEVCQTAMVKSDLTAIKHLDIIKSTQANWVIPGTLDPASKLIHNVSCTVLVSSDEWKTVVQYLYDNRQYFAAVSLLSTTGDKQYKQAPMEEIVTPEDQVAFDQLKSKWTKINYSQFTEDDDTTKLQQEFVCTGGACEIKQL